MEEDILMEIDLSFEERIERSFGPSWAREA